MDWICKKKNKIFYPTSEVSFWEDLKEFYNNYGYEWVNLDICKNVSKIKKVDDLNSKKFIELKGNESCLRNSLRGVKVPFIVPPPMPNHYERYRLLKKWSKNKDCFNISMAAVDLYKNHGLEPCKDYDPVNVLHTYYDEKRKEQNILNSSNSSSGSNIFNIRQTPTAPEINTEGKNVSPPGYCEI